MEKVLTPKKVLVVDPDPAVSRALWNSCGFIADIENCGDFEDARASLELITAIYYSAETGSVVTLPIGSDHPKYGGWVPERRRFG